MNFPCVLLFRSQFYDLLCWRCWPFTFSSECCISRFASPWCGSASSLVSCIVWIFVFCSICYPVFFLFVFLTHFISRSYLFLREWLLVWDLKAAQWFLLQMKVEYGMLPWTMNIAFSSSFSFYFLKPACSFPVILFLYSWTSEPWLLLFATFLSVEWLMEFWRFISLLMVLAPD